LYRRLGDSFSEEAFSFKGHLLAVHLEFFKQVRDRALSEALESGEL